MHIKNIPEVTVSFMGPCSWTEGHVCLLDQKKGPTLSQYEPSLLYRKPFLFLLVSGKIQPEPAYAYFPRGCCLWRHLQLKCLTLIIPHCF